MRHLVRSAVVLVVLAVALSGLAIAGHGGKCTKAAAECAAHTKEAYQTKGWMGIEADKSEEGIKVLSVLPNSPAERAGIKAGDVLVSINGVAYSAANEEKLGEMKKSAMKIGSTVAYGVKRGAETLDVNVTLERIPDTVLADMIEKHKQEHQVAKN